MKTIPLNYSVFLLQQAGLHPTADQIELFAYHLPKATLCNLIVCNSMSLFDEIVYLDTIVL